MSYSFQSSPLWLDLFLSIFCFFLWCCCKQNHFFFRILVVSVKKCYSFFLSVNFVFCTLPNSLIRSNSFLMDSLGFLYIKLCHSQTDAVLLLSFWFRCLSFLFLAWVLWLGILVLCLIGVVREGTLFLFTNYLKHFFSANFMSELTSSLFWMSQLLMRWTFKNYWLCYFHFL